jgi:CoA:oxalate CoA-transferase
MLLADLGARVIKVETPRGGDDSRGIGPFLKGKSAYFMSLNRGKKSIVLDLKALKDREIFLRLVAQADVLVENYRGGTMEKLDLGWESLHRRFPHLIYAAASGFGHTGPYATRPAYDMVVQAMGGIMSITGQPGGPPTRVGSSIGDLGAGLFTTIGIASALYHRALTGQSQKIDVSMLDCQVAMLENAIARYVTTGKIPGPLGARHPSIAPFEAFEVKDGYIVIAAGNDALFERLLQVVDLTDLKNDARFKTNALRCEHVEALKQILEMVLRTQTAAEWLAGMQSAGIPCGPLNNVAEVLDDVQVRARNMVVHLDDPEAGRLAVAGNPVKFSAFADPQSRDPAPGLDADRVEVLTWLERKESAGDSLS